jgi:hypothetical protein
MLSEGLYGLLSGEPTIQKVIAQMPDKTYAVFPAQMPPDCPLPAIAFMQISGSGCPTMEGAEAFHVTRMQFSCYGETYIAAKKLATAARRFLEGFNGKLADGSEVDTMTLVLESDGFEEAPLSYHVPFDMEICYRDVGD